MTCHHSVPSGARRALRSCSQIRLHASRGHQRRGLGASGDLGYRARVDLLRTLGPTRAANVRIALKSSRIPRVLDETLAGSYGYTSRHLFSLTKFFKSNYTFLISDDSARQGSTFKPYQPVSNEQISQVIALQECLNTNTLGQLWTSSMPFLYPFIVQFRYVLNYIYQLG